MRNPFTFKTSTGSSPDMSKFSKRMNNILGQSHLQKSGRTAYMAGFKQGKKEKKLLINLVPTTAGGELMEGMQPYAPDSTAAQQGETIRDTRGSRVDFAHQQRNQSTSLARDEDLLTSENVTATIPKRGVQGSENGIRHHLTTFRQSVHRSEKEKGQQQPDTMESWDNFEKETKATAKKLEDTTTELEVAKHRNQSLEAKNKLLEDQLASLSTQLHGVKAEHQQTLQLLEAKKSALKGIQVFLTKEDSFSGADVIAMVDALNAEILQLAAFMADRLEDTQKVLDAAAEEVKARAVRSLGEPLVHMLGNIPVQPNPDQDPMRLQIALQVSLIYSCNQIIESWMPGVWKYGDFLADIHSRIVEAEPQSVSGRWRAITRSHVKHLEDFYPRVMTFIAAQIDNVLTVAGLSQKLLKEQGLLDILQERLTVIGMLALRLQTTIGENVISGDMHTVLIAPNAHFDPERMDDGFSQDGQSTTTGGERVACTTDIGLERSAKNSGIQILRKPKVVLYSALE